MTSDISRCACQKAFADTYSQMEPHACLQGRRESALSIVTMQYFGGIPGWEWEGPWEADEWAYAPDWSVMSYPPSASSRSRNLVDFVRRKRWVRRRRRQQTSPGGILLHPAPACLRQATLPVQAGQRRQDNAEPVCQPQVPDQVKAETAAFAGGCPPH